MKIKSLLLLLFCILSPLQLMASYPQILAWKKAPLLAFDNKKQVKLKMNEALKFPFAVLTKEKDQLSLRVNTFDELVLYPKSQLQVMSFADDSGSVSDLYFLGGQLRYTAKQRNQQKTAQPASSDSTSLVEQLVIKTPFFDLKTLSEADFIVVLDMKEPSVEVKVLAGQLPLEFFAYEKKLTLQAGQSVKFVGEFADNKLGIQYDYLLNNRKVPRGKLQDVKSFSVEDFLKSEKQAIEHEKQIFRDRAEKEKERLRKIKEYEDSFLCKKPFGQKNQCYWKLDGQACSRYRCDINANWEDKTPRPLQDCKRKLEVGSCDY